MWSCSVPLWKQYLLSYYWGATTLTTQALAGLATPKNATELTFAIVCMVCTMTIYAYIIGALRFGMLFRSLHVFAVACAQDCACEPQQLACFMMYKYPKATCSHRKRTHAAGELSNLVMRNDAELVERRDKVSIVQLFVGRRALPASLARDVVATYYENATANRDLEAIFPALSSNLQVHAFARLHRIDALDTLRPLQQAEYCHLSWEWLQGCSAQHA